MYRLNLRLICRAVGAKVVQREFHLVTMLEKSDESGKSSKLGKALIFPSPAEIKIEGLNSSQVDGLLQEAINETDNKMILRILKQGRPSRYSLEKLLFSSMKNPEQVELVRKFQRSQEWMKPYLVGSMWYSGNCSEAARRFKALYFENDPQTVLVVLKDITMDTVGHKSEAVLVILTQLAEYYVCFFDDYRLLTFLWRALFTSEWWSDQQHAATLFQKHPPMRKLVEGRITEFCQFLLARDDTDASYRLLEQLLKFNDTREPVRFMLVVMFDHCMFRKDMRQCAEIVHFAQSLGILLRKEQTSRWEVVRKSRKTPAFKFKF